jgi:phosphate transport system permease protein
MDADYAPLWRSALISIFPDVSDRQKRRALYAMISSSAGDILRDVVLNDFAVIGATRRIWVPVDDAVDVFYKDLEHLDKERMTDRQREQVSWLERLKNEGRIEKRLNTIFFTNGDSREPELAGIWGAVSGSLLTLLVTLGLSFPVGIAAALYLEEFAPKNRWTDIVEVNINNLAAVPSIVYGLLGLAVFINTFHLPRSSPLVGGLVLTLMTLPVMIIAGRSALKSVPPSIREAALGIGASPLQAVLDHVLPLAMPGMLTGSIIGAARALGESAPLLMIGMVAFIVDVPNSINDPATVLPVQIYLWADSPEHAFTEKTSAAILVLLAFLITMNGCAVYLRKHYERRW